MHALRARPSLTRLVLAWFVLTLAVAAASPLVREASMAVVCTAGAGAQLLVADRDGTLQDAKRHTLDCPLCLLADAPPSPGVLAPATPLPPALALERFFAARSVTPAGAPLPARGPPSLS